MMLRNMSSKEKIRNFPGNENIVECIFIIRTVEINSVVEQAYVKNTGRCMKK